MIQRQAKEEMSLIETKLSATKERLDKKEKIKVEQL